MQKKARRGTASHDRKGRRLGDGTWVCSELYAFPVVENVRIPWRTERRLCSEILRPDQRWFHLQQTQGGRRSVHILVGLETMYADGAKVHKYIYCGGLSQRSLINVLCCTYLVLLQRLLPQLLVDV